MTVFRNISGTWRPAQVWRNIGGTWRQGLLWRNIGGVWKQLSLQVDFNDVNVVGASSGAITVGYRILQNGFDQRNTGGTYTNNQQGITPGSETTNYEVRATIIGGNTAPSGSGTGTWLDLGVSLRTWQVTRSTVGTSDCQLQMDIRRKGTGPAVDTWIVYLQATRL